MSCSNQRSYVKYWSLLAANDDLSVRPAGILLYNGEYSGAVFAVVWCAVLCMRGIQHTKQTRYVFCVRSLRPRCCQTLQTSAQSRGWERIVQPCLYRSIVKAMNFSTHSFVLLTETEERKRETVRLKSDVPINRPSLNTHHYF